MIGSMFKLPAAPAIQLRPYQAEAVEAPHGHGKTPLRHARLAERRIEARRALNRGEEDVLGEVVAVVVGDVVPRQREPDAGDDRVEDLARGASGVRIGLGGEMGARRVHVGTSEEADDFPEESTEAQAVDLGAVGRRLERG